MVHNFGFNVLDWFNIEENSYVKWEIFPFFFFFPGRNYVELVLFRPVVIEFTSEKSESGVSFS
jgi:hypothetical protein